ncbi:MAG TPA: hypothetical protein VEH79_01600 [Gaiellaceae bacterium]|nr:hypothetical protein [Gaiellaceae bacterium]
MTITNQTVRDYTFGPYHLPAGSGQQITIDTTTSASLYLIDDAVADIVNQLYALGYITVSNQPTPFPRVTGVPAILHGDGNPEGIVFAPQGSAFMRRDNSGAGNALYAKSTGVTISTGWQPFAGAIVLTPATNLPGSPTDGQQAILVDSTSAPTYAWLLQWSVAASKWLFIGGSPATSHVVTSESTSSTSYVDLTTVQSITVARAGTYIIEGGFDAPTASGGGENFAGVKVGASAAVQLCHIDLQTQCSVAGFITASANASDAIKMQFSVNSGSAGSFENRWMKITPVTLT